MRITTATSIAAIFAAALTASVSAENHRVNPDEKNMMQDRFNTADTNNDGLVSHDEAMARVKAKFDGLDSNGSGFLELAELPKEMPVPEHMQRRMDRHKAKMKSHMENHKGDDAGKMQKHMRQRMGEHDMRQGKLSRLKFVAKLDRDGDEKVSMEEFSVRAIKRFKHHDLDGDGNVSLAEIEKASKHRMMKKRHKEEKRHHG